MKRFVEGANRGQIALFPAHLDGYFAQDNIIRIVEAFIKALVPTTLGFVGVEPARTVRLS